MKATDFRPGDVVKMVNPDYACSPCWGQLLHTVLRVSGGFVFLSWDSYNDYWLRTMGENSVCIIRRSEDLKYGAGFDPESLQIIARPHHQLMLFSGLEEI